MTSVPLACHGRIPPDAPADKLGLIVIDHGSRREESNRQLLDVVRLLEAEGSFQIVEPAHMEIAQPDMQTAMDRCLDRGACYLVIHPWFLGPGRHWREHIPALAAQAASKHPGVSYVVSEPLGLHPGLIQAATDRIQSALQRAISEERANNACGEN